MIRASAFSLWSSRIGWLVLIWLASVASLAVVATAMHLVMGFAGLTE